MEAEIKCACAVSKLGYISNCKMNAIMESLIFTGKDFVLNPRSIRRQSPIIPLYRVLTGTCNTHIFMDGIHVHCVYFLILKLLSQRDGRSNVGEQDSTVLC